MIKKRPLIISFVLSFLYVLLGTIVVLVCFPDYEILGFNDDHYLWGVLCMITFPVNILLFGLVMVEDSFIWIVGLQIIVLFICWFVFYNMLKIMSKK